MDYYKILNVNIFSSEEKIKKSYRELAKLYHPDRNAGDDIAADKFKEITEAYDVLSDKKKRMEYNIKYLANNKYVITGLAALGLGVSIIVGSKDFIYRSFYFLCILINEDMLKWQTKEIITKYWE